MKKIVLMAFVMAVTVTIKAQEKQAVKKVALEVVEKVKAAADGKEKKGPEITFEKTTHDFGTFAESSAKQTCTFSFTNTGNVPLIINQAVASCGCTIPTFSKDPVAPGAKGEITVVYDGTGKFPGHFKKTITIRSNATNSLVRLYIEGTMVEDQK